MILGRLSGLGLAFCMTTAFGCYGDGGLPDSLTPFATAAPPKDGGVAAFSPTVALPPLPPLSGDKLLYRFTDHAGEAELEVSDLQERMAAFDSPYKLTSPYSGLRGEAALRVIEVAIADPLVEKYPRSGQTEKNTAATPAPRFDPVWNRYRGVYESKVALFAPAPSCYRFRVGPFHSKRLQLGFYTAVIPPTQQKSEASGADVEFSIQLEGKQLFHTRTSRKDGSVGRWTPGELTLSGEDFDKGPRQLSFCTSTASNGAPAGTAVWGSPELYGEGEGAAAPSLLLILVDTLRRDALPVMPKLRAYAQGGVSFSQAITPATWTRPALLGILGGDLPTAVGQSADEMIPSERDRKRFYALDRRLLPRLLREAGYKVASIGNNFFLLGYPQIGLSLGFDEVADVRHPVEDSPAITRAALAFLQKNQHRSFFLQLHYDAPHWPYTPPPEHLRGIPDELAAEYSGQAPGATPVGPIDPMAKNYLGEAAYADAQIAPVLEELKRLGLSERTLVVVLGDHGEVFDPLHNHFVQALHQPTLYHHGWSAYDEVLRVPLVLSMPGRLPANVEVPSQIRLIDVAPTALELLGLGAWRSLLPSGARGAGQSLLPLILPGPGGKKGPAPDRPAFFEGQNIRGLRNAGYLYLRRGDPRLQRAQGDSGTGPIYKVSEELYDLQKDPQQHKDLLLSARDAKPGTQGDIIAALAPEVAETLRKMRDDFSRYAPLPPEQGLPITHLLLATDSRMPHLMTGTLSSSDPALSVQGVRSGEVVPRGPGRIDVTLRPGGTLDVLVDPAARLELSLFRDGLSLGPRELLLGPFSLPLLPAGGTIVLEGAALDRLSAAYPPVPGERGEVLLWRDQAAPGVAAAATAKTGNNAGEVETLMRDWGYARGDAHDGGTAK